MPEKDRLEALIEQVEKLAGAVVTLAELQTEQERRVTAVLEQTAKGLDGIGKLNAKVGALAAAMDRNMDQVATAREAFVKRQKQVAEQVRIMTGSPRAESYETSSS